MNERLRRLPPYPMLALEQKKRSLLATGQRLFDFGTDDPVEPTPSFIQAALRDAVSERCPYPSVGGRQELRAAAAGYLQRRFSVTVDPDAEVLPTLGSKEALFHLPQMLVQIPSEKDLVLYGEPAWPVFEVGALFAEAWTYPVKLSQQNGFLMDPEIVPESVLRRCAIVFLNYPHNPSGQCLPDALFKAWVEARDRYGFTLVSHESYADLYFEGAPPRSLLEFGKQGCLVVQSLSKRSGMSGYRSGFVAGDAGLIAHQKRFRASIGTAPQDFVQAAATAAWNDDAHVAERRQVFGEKRRILKQHFASLGLQVYPGTAGLFLWVTLPAGTTGEDYAARCLQHGILVAPGSWFGGGLEGFVRVALVPSVADCEAATKVWPR